MASKAIRSTRSHSCWLVYGPVKSKIDWSDNLAAIFEAKLTFNSPSSCVEPIFLECAEIQCFLF